MFKQVQAAVSSFKARKAELLQLSYTSVVWSMFVMLALSVMPMDAMAQSFSSGSFDVPFVSGIGCKVASWMKGPLAILIFVIVCIAILVIGLISKMDWARMITVAVVFGIIQSITTLLLSSGQINMSGCIGSI